MPDVMTVIIRLVSEGHDVERIRGTLQALEEEEPRSFGDGKEMLEILRNLLKERHDSDEGKWGPDRSRKG